MENKIKMDLTKTRCEGVTEFSGAIWESSNEPWVPWATNF